MRLRLSQNLQKNQTRGKRVHRRSVMRPFLVLMVPSIRLQEPVASATMPSTVVYPTQRNRSGAPAVAQGRAIAVWRVSSRPLKNARHTTGRSCAAAQAAASRMLSTRAHVRPRSGEPILNPSTVCLG